MAQLSQKEQLAFHEFSVRYRAAWAKQHATPQSSMDTVNAAVREEWEREQEANRAPKIEGPPIEGPAIEPPTPAAGREPEEPDFEP